jgi:hypothetical protein
MTASCKGPSCHLFSTPLYLDLSLFNRVSIKVKRGRPRFIMFEHFSMLEWCAWQVVSFMGLYLFHEGDTSGSSTIRKDIDVEGSRTRGATIRGFRFLIGHDCRQGARLAEKYQRMFMGIWFLVWCCLVLAMFIQVCVVYAPGSRVSLTGRITLDSLFVCRYVYKARCTWEKTRGLKSLPIRWLIEKGTSRFHTCGLHFQGNGEDPLLHRRRMWCPTARYLAWRWRVCHVMISKVSLIY